MSDKISETKLEMMASGMYLPHFSEAVMVARELIARRAAEVKHPDKVRMDWLCAHCVQVRDPMFYGSNAMFWAQSDSADDEEHHTKLREQVDSAINSADGDRC